MPSVIKNVIACLVWVVWVVVGVAWLGLVTLVLYIVSRMIG